MLLLTEIFLGLIKKKATYNELLSYMVAGQETDCIKVKHKKTNYFVYIWHNTIYDGAQIQIKYCLENPATDPRAIVKDIMTKIKSGNWAGAPRRRGGLTSSTGEPRWPQIGVL